MPVQLSHPPLEAVELGAVYAALADRHRRRVVVRLASEPGTEVACSTLDVPGSKSTRSYHWKVLREAGFILQRSTGTGMLLRLRPDFEERFPGLLDSLLRLEGSATPEEP
ncbi:helix-turn-helix domain-containing protein [Streptomyces sp. TRM43335]|uniref:Helix-turn-helix domain-containing protein n=1 Tax=Streptomyces taklimakanensis TaxID=2569853 RepID=A0A6G2BJT7_9ACTN|nr:helix-turn-helix transcriptional regulator [Streptomyces taklimakanensis]MTE22323.1 helix-turn-helix domain-containing protein [Streptomyces taklimakanensis]